MPSGRRGTASDGESLLAVARRLGIDIESICGGRLTCAKCKVRIDEGSFPKHGISSSAFNLSQSSDEESTLLASASGSGTGEYRLACAADVCGDLLVYVPEESRAHKQTIHKAAGERVIAIAPAVRQVYVEVEPATLGEHRGDWGRLQTALHSQWDLSNLQIDLAALRKLQPALRQGKWAVTVTLWEDREVIDVQSGFEEGVFGLAVDVGSTTVAAHLCDLRTGRLLATESMMNPQVAYGEDLMSRVSFAMANRSGLGKMRNAIVDALNTLAARAARQAGLQARDIHEAVIVGNTTMIHILLGINPQELGSAPFALALREAMDLKARELDLRLHAGANVHILPAQAGHVGADNVAVLIAEEPYRQEKNALIVDVGTNAEIILGNNQRLYSASSPTGPAFEGAQIAFGMRAAPGAIERVRIDPETWEARFRVIGEERWSDLWPMDAAKSNGELPKNLAAGICGSGIIEVVAELYMAGIIGGNGRFNTFRPHQRLVQQGKTASYILATGTETASGQPILVTQDDIRNVQLAKAALYSGIRLLMNRAGIERVEHITLAGAFGSYIDPKHAMILGLIPDCDLDHVIAVGNAAGDGARIALLNRHKRLEAQQYARQVTYVETAVDPDFQNEFVSALQIPHASNVFPHLEKVLDGPLPANGESSEENKRMRRAERLRIRQMQKS